MSSSFKDEVVSKPPNSSRGKIFVGSLGVLISAGLLWYLLRDLNWNLFLLEIKKANPLHLMLMLILFYFSFLARAVRWKYLLPSSENYSVKKLFDATMVGFFASTVLPLRAGEVIRPLALSRWQNVPGLTAFASIVVERVFDVMAIMIILGLCMSKINSSEGLELVILGAQGLSLIAIVIGLVMLVAYVRPDFLLSMVDYFLDLSIRKRFPDLSSGISKIAKEFVEGFRSISTLSELGLVVFWSAMLWISVSLLYQSGLWAMGESPDLLVGFTVSAFIALAVAAPSAPGFVGTFQYGCVFALHDVFAYSREQALAYSVIVHLFQVAIILVHGMYILNREGLGIADIRESQKES